MSLKSFLHNGVLEICQGRSEWQRKNNYLWEVLFPKSTQWRRKSLGGIQLSGRLFGACPPPHNPKTSFCGSGQSKKSSVSSFEGDRMSSAFDAVGRVKSQHRINEAIRPTHEEWQEYSSRIANCCSISPATGSIRPCFEDTIGIDQRNNRCRQEAALKSQPTCPPREPESSAKSLAQRVAILSAKCVAFASSLNITGLKLPLLRNQERKHMFKSLKRKKKAYPAFPVSSKSIFTFLSLEAEDSLDFIKRLKTRPFI